MKKVKDVMVINHIVHCTPETNLHNVAKMMKETNVGSLPVVDKGNKVVGIITDRDICLTLATKSNKNPAEKSVKDIIAHTKIHTVKTEDNLKKALREMRTNKISRLPVTDKRGALLGILSINNIISKSLNKKGKLGKISSSKENMARTIKSLFDRNKPHFQEKNAIVA